jgi:hypothetical protein
VVRGIPGLDVKGEVWRGCTREHIRAELWVLGEVDIKPFFLSTLRASPGATRLFLKGPGQETKHSSYTLKQKMIFAKRRTIRNRYKSL